MRYSHLNEKADNRHLAYSNSWDPTTFVEVIYVFN